jgi:hypothetical protein
MKSISIAITAEEVGIVVTGAIDADEFLRVTSLRHRLTHRDWGNDVLGTMEH